MSETTTALAKVIEEADVDFLHIGKCQGKWNLDAPRVGAGSWIRISNSSLADALEEFCRLTRPAQVIP